MHSAISRKSAIAVGGRFLLILFLLLLVIGIPVLIAQDTAVQGEWSVEGRITDAQTSEPLQGANIALFALPDTLLVRGASTDAAGMYGLRRVPDGSYLMQVSYVGYFTQIDSLFRREGETLRRDFALRLNEGELEEIRITGRLPRMEVRGDTTAFNADAFTTGRNASVEDLISRMPGIVVQDGQVEAQGEQVRRVLVDGNEFFGDDAALALRNLPAEIVQQIEVFDRMGEQARFTGFDDGSSERTLNIVTRSGIRNGQFGRVQSGYGSDDRYTAGGNYNYFSGNRRVSVLGLTNNINQVNFSGEDLVGVQEAAGGGGGRGGRRGGGGGGWGATRDFRIGQGDGINTTHSFGLNYVDRWTDSFRLNGSYFFNTTDNEREVLSERRYTGGIAGNQLYDEFSGGNTDNHNHRLNMRMEYQMTESSSLVFTPRMSVQQNASVSFFRAFTQTGQGALLNQTFNENENDRLAWDFSGSLLYRQRFQTPGRTLSVNLSTDMNNRSGDQYRLGETLFFDEDSNEILENQYTDTNDGGYSVSPNVSFTEALGERSQLQFTYNPSYSLSRSDRETFNFNEQSGAYDDLDAGLSNRYENRIWRQRLNTGYNFRHDRFRLNLNMAYENTLLRGEQEFPFEAGTRQVYHNLLPGATLSFNVAENGNMRIRYNTNTRTPSANQLQDVIDNSNPLQLRGGNPDLQQQYAHSLSVRYRLADPESGSSTMLFMNAGMTNDAITNVTYIAERDSLLPGNIRLGAGSRFTRPENVGRSWNIRTFVARGFVLDAVSSNINLNGGGSFSSTPSAVNNRQYMSNTWSLYAGTVISSNISEEIDFRVSYRGTYNIVDNSVPTGFDSNYYTGTASLRISLQPWRGLLFESDTRIRHFSGLQDDFNNNSVFWNVGAGYRFLENRALELKATVVDVLRQNDEVSRIIEDTYIEDVRSNVLSRYVIVSLTYNFRSVQAGAPQRPVRDAPRRRR